MSSLTNQQDTTLKPYLINQSEPEESEAAEEKPTEQTSAFGYGAYTPSRASYHTMSGKIKRYFA